MTERETADARNAEARTPKSQPRVEDPGDSEYQQHERDSLPPAPEGPHATTRQKAVLSAVLAVCTVVALIGWFFVFTLANEAIDREYSVVWERPSGVELDAGPVNFWYDAQSKRLIHRGPIEGEKKILIAGLAKSSAGETDKLQTYRDAVGELAYKSAESNSDIFVIVLWLGAISGFLGVTARSMNNMVGMACYKRQLRLCTWWPWYVVRPFIGVVVGVLTIVLSQAQLLFTANTANAGTLWWLSVSFLAGYGVDEFMHRVRLVSQTLFGHSKQG